MNKAVIAALVLVALGIGYLTFAADSPDAKQRRANREAITQCRALVDDELQALADRRAIRARCETLTTAFREKWGIDP